MFYTANRNRARLKRLRTAMRLFSDGSEAYSRARGKHALSDRRFETIDCVFPFFMSCRTSLYGGATLTFGHQLSDAAKCLRGALEAAFYAYRVFSEPAAWERWATRPSASRLRTSAGLGEARKQRSAVGREFSVPTIARNFPSDAARLASAAIDLYEELIDVGGHFNEPVFQASTEMIVHERVAEIRYRLIGGDDREIGEALDRLATTAGMCLRIFALAFAEFWDERLIDRIGYFTTRK